MIIVPMVFIAALMFLIGIFPHKVIWLTSGISANLIKANTATEINRIIGLASALSIALIIFYGILAAILLFRIIMYRKDKVEYFKTWDCGYQGGSPRIQYTASSFSADTVHVTRPILITKYT